MRWGWKLHIVAYGAAALILGACASDSPKGPFLASYKSVSDTEKAELLKALSQFNGAAGRTLVSESSGSYPIHVRVADSSVIDTLPPYQANRQGHAIRNAGHCDLYLFEGIVQTTHRSDLDRGQAVFIHELGHCLGQEHQPDPEDIMYPVNKGLSLYSAASFEGFVNRLLSSVDIH